MPQCFSSHNVSLHLCLFSLLISISLHLCLFFCSSLLLFFSRLSFSLSSLLFSRSSLLLIFSSSHLLVSCLIFFCLSSSVFSSLSLPSSLLSLSSCRVFFLCLHSLSLSVSLHLCLRVVLCVSLWPWCVCVCVCLVCGVCAFRQAEKTWKKPCVDSTTFPCVHSKRPRVYRHHAHMCRNMCAWCRQARGLFERTHGVHGRRQPRIFHRKNKQKMNMFMSILT